MKASERSPQQTAAAAVHMCGLWVQFPASALSYLDIWERLLLHGGTSASHQHPVRASHCDVCVMARLMLLDSRSGLKLSCAHTSADSDLRIKNISLHSKLVLISCRMLFGVKKKEHGSEGSLKSS